MSIEELLRAMEWLKVETGSLACLGCECESNCSVHGCRILREAIVCIRGCRIIQEAIVCIRGKQFHENHEPLTLEELYAVRNREPILVYAVCIDDETKQPDFELAEWQIFDGYVFYNDESRDDLSNYGERFVAYRHKPEV